MSRFSEIDVLADVKVSAGIRGNSASGSAGFVIIIGNYQAASVSCEAKEGGGIYIPSCGPKEESINVKFKKNGDSWDIYKNEIKISTVPGANPGIKLHAVAGGNYGKGSAVGNVYLSFKGGQVSIMPKSPSPPSIKNIIDGVALWIQEILNKILFLTISGAENPLAGTTQTYTVVLDAPSLSDGDYSDGTYSTKYCNIALVKSDSTVISEKGFVKCENLQDSFTVKVPSESGKYVIVGLIVESQGTFDYALNQWSYSPYVVVAKEAINVETKQVIAPSDAPKPSGIGGFLASIWSFIIGIFK